MVSTLSCYNDGEGVQTPTSSWVVAASPFIFNTIALSQLGKQWKLCS